MSVKITYRLTKEITADGDYKVSIDIISSENITKKVVVYEDGGTPLYIALPDDISVYPEDEPETPGGRYRLASASVTVDNVHHATSEANAFAERIDRLVREYAEQDGDFPGTEQVTVEYGT